MKILKAMFFCMAILLALPSEAVPDQPDRGAAAARFRALALKNERGEIPVTGYADALKQRSALVSPYPTKKHFLSAGIASNKWTELGPSNIGGRIRSMVIHPTNPNKMWVGSTTGGIWTSSNAGAWWKPVNDFMPKLTFGALLINPVSPDIMYAGSGECMDDHRGMGIFKSTDGGINWTPLAQTMPADEDSSWLCVKRLAMHPTNPNIILAATSSKWSNISTIWRTDDAGDTWTNVGGGGLPKAGGLDAIVHLEDVVFDPNDGNKAIAGGNNGDVAYSRDAGVTWSKVSLVDGGQRTMIAYAKSTPNLVYASVDRNDGEIYASTDGGASWTLKSNAKQLSQGFNASAIWVDPVDAKHVIVAGIDIFRSTDGAETFNKISTWDNSPPSPHADHHVILNDPGYNGASNRRIYNTNDGGVYRANDITLANDGSDGQSNGWESLNNGLAITQFYSGAGRTGTKIFGGAQDNGTLGWLGDGTIWTEIWGGDGGYSAIDSKDGNYFYGEYIYLDIFRSDDNRASGNGSRSVYDSQGHNIICQGIAEANKARCGGTEKANFIAPFILDQNNDNRMLAGAASLWVSNDVKATPPTWSAIKQPSAAKDNFISAIAVAKGNPDAIWVAHNNGEVYRTGNGTAVSPNWILVSTTDMPNRYATSIYIDNDNANKVYVTFGGYSADNIWRTTDNGASWSSISGALPAAPIRSITRHPTKPDWLYAGTDVGLFTSEDGGANWFTTNDGPANVQISELFWLDNSNLAAATYGRGMFKTTLGATGVATAPNAPAIGNATAGNASATVNFTAPSVNGSKITGYTVLANPGGVTASGPASPINITGLTNGTSYTFTVTATNGAGASAASASSNAVTPVADFVPVAPAAPTIGSVTFSDGVATVTIIPPGSDGGSPITGYTVSSDPAGGADTNAASAGLVHKINGLTDGTNYTFLAVAINAVGQSTPSPASSSGVPARVPDAPVMGKVTATSDGNYSVSFTPPASNGGSAITRYVVTGISDAMDGESAAPDIVNEGTTTPILISSKELAYGTPYYFFVTAINAVGESDPSDASAAITLGQPATIPDDASAIIATAGNAKATVGFSAPADNGSKITGYTVTSNPGGITASGTASPITVTGLTNQTAYTFTVIATNAIGDGPASVPSNSVTPSETPATGTALQLNTGWNLLGNSVNAPLDVAATWGDTARVTAVWKWIPATSKWAFYAPSLTAPALTTYAASKGYDVLATINGGEGFWVDARDVFAVQLPAGTPIGTNVFADQPAPPNNLPTGWSLIAVGDNPSPRSFVNAIAIGKPVAPDVAATSLTALWAWDSGSSQWYFYAPSLDNSSGLSNYITTKHYNDFGAKTLDPTMGFWVAKGTAVTDLPPSRGADMQQPAVPAGLTATAVSGTQVNLAWMASTDNTGVAQYKVYRDAQLVNSSAGTSYSDTGLTASTTYSYTVAACDAAGNCSAQSGTASATTQAAATKANQTISFGTVPSIAVGGTGVVSATATSGFAVSFSSTTPSVCTVSGSTVTGVAVGTCTIAANQAGDANYNAATQVTQSITVGSTLTTGMTLNLVQSWNLVGNSVNTQLDVATTLGDTTKVTTVWKWIPATSKWAFYTPSFADGGAAYAATKGYDFLTVINGGEGFWVNAKTAFTAQLPAGTSVGTSYFQDQLDPVQNKLAKGWNLISTGDNVTPSVFNAGLSMTPPAQGVIPLNVTTLWAWDSALANWYFYAPSLEASGGLVNYIITKSYLDFAQHSKTLGQDVGFWVNKP